MSKEEPQTKAKVIPQCIGIIMDGNRRWARQKGVPGVEGHRMGFKKLKEVLEWCKEADVRHVVVYAFSTENWTRPSDEITYLMDLFREMSKELDKEEKEDATVHFVGDLARFPNDIEQSMKETNERAKKDATYHLWVAASYGGRAEIVAGVNKLLSEGKDIVTEDEFSRALWTAAMPDPDIIVRTGGERRLSNFVTWASVYSELFFVDTHWPAFAQEELQDILEAYGKRERRRGR